MASKTFYYARVSTRDQNLDRQLEAFRKLGADERDIITDKESGKDLDRTGYRALRETLLRPGDTLVIKSLDRLSRCKADIKAELEYFQKNGVHVKIIDMPTTMTDWPEEQRWVGDMINNILIEVMGTIAEQERVTIRQRQAEGIAAAKSAGRHLGRPKAVFPSGWAEVYALWNSGSITAVQAMDRLSLKKSTFYKLVKAARQGAE